MQKLHNFNKAEKNIGFFVKTALPPVEGVFFDGQIFDAYTIAAGEPRKNTIFAENFHYAKNIVHHSFYHYDIIRILAGGLVRIQPLRG